MIEVLNKILKDKYDIKPNKMSTQQGGWASLAYKIEDENENNYILKAYEKNRKSTSYLVEHIDTYLPIVDWLYNRTTLKGKMVRLIKMQNQDYKFEDENYVCILFDYIEGKTVGEEILTDEQVMSLVDIVSELHNLKTDFPFDTRQIHETFHLPFISKLHEWLGDKFKELKTDLQGILKPKFSNIENKINECNYLSKFLKEQDLTFCLCHTDIHHWNIIATDKQLFLLDWEGIKFAPAEADIFCIYHEPYFDLFLSRYCELNPDYQVNQAALQYYLIARRLQDIFEFIEQLQFDELTEDDYKTSLNHLIEQVNLINS